MMYCKISFVFGRTCFHTIIGLLLILFIFCLPEVESELRFQIVLPNTHARINLPRVPSSTTIIISTWGKHVQQDSVLALLCTQIAILEQFFAHSNTFSMKIFNPLLPDFNFWKLSAFEWIGNKSTSCETRASSHTLLVMLSNAYPHTYTYTTYPTYLHIFILEDTLYPLTIKLPQQMGILCS